MHLLDQFQPNLEKYRPKGKNEDINIVGAQGSYMKQLIKKKRVPIWNNNDQSQSQQEIRVGR